MVWVSIRNNKHHAIQLKLRIFTSVRSKFTIHQIQNIISIPRIHFNHSWLCLKYSYVNCAGSSCQPRTWRPQLTLHIHNVRVYCWVQDLNWLLRLSYTDMFGFYINDVYHLVCKTIPKTLSELHTAIILVPRARVLAQIYVRSLSPWIILA